MWMHTNVSACTCIYCMYPPRVCVVCACFLFYLSMYLCFARCVVCILHHITNLLCFENKSKKKNIHIYIFFNTYIYIYMLPHTPYLSAFFYDFVSCVYAFFSTCLSICFSRAAVSVLFHIHNHWFQCQKTFLCLLMYTYPCPHDSISLTPASL